MNENDREELSAVFREEAKEIIDQIEVVITRLGTIEDERYGEKMKVALRLAHNLKGAARTVGFDDTEKLAHEIEDALLPAKIDRAALTDRTIRNIREWITAIQLHLDDSKPRPAPQSEPPMGRDESIRVDTTRFDKVIGFSGELLISKARMSARSRRIDRLFKELQRMSKLDPGNARLLAPVLQEARQIAQLDRKDLLDFGHLVAEMSDAMKRLRMVPLTRARASWRGTVRETAHALGKEINLTISSGEIELDKHVLDQLRDPMMHLLRNAVDHGIESAERRAAANKPEAGRIMIQATVMGAMVRLEVSDDGGGVDLDRVRATAVSQGIIPAELGTNMSQEESLALLFEPGFSTAPKVSHVSGRGVGLDVVRSQLEDLGGSVSIAPSGSLGGTTFLLSVPLSILSTLGLFVRAGDTVYALPVEYVERTIRVSREDVRQVDGKTVVELDGDTPVRIVWLSDLMGAPNEAAPSVLKVAILSRADMQLGLVFDEVIGQQEFVTQALPWNFRQVPGVNGAIILADGGLAISLDVPHIFDRARFSSLESQRNPGKETTRASKRILVVDDSLASRTVGRNMLQSTGHEILLASDGQEAWSMLQKESIDLVVSDVNMPRMDGCQLTEKIRSSPDLGDLPVILFTSLDSPDDVARGADAGADEYIIKGTFDQGSLLELVAKYI